MAFWSKKVKRLGRPYPGEIPRTTGPTCEECGELHSGLCEFCPQCYPDCWQTEMLYRELYNRPLGAWRNDKQ